MRGEGTRSRARHLASLPHDLPLRWRLGCQLSPAACPLRTVAYSGGMPDSARQLPSSATECASPPGARPNRVARWALR